MQRWAVHPTVAAAVQFYDLTLVDLFKFRNFFFFDAGVFLPLADLFLLLLPVVAVGVEVHLIGRN